MEGDDATVACIALHVIDDVVCRNPLGVVACHQVPHHNFEVFPEPVVLTPAHHSVGRTEEVGVDKLVGLEGVDDVGYRPVLEGSQVVIGVVAYLVTFGLDALIELRVFIDIIAHHEESGFNVKLPEGVENKRCGLGNGAVVEGQIDGLHRRIHSPHCFRKNPAQPL